MNPHLNMATDIAELACALDHYKKTLPQSLQQEAINLVRDLHTLAQLLLGADEDMIYARDDEEDSAFRMASASWLGDCHD